MRLWPEGTRERGPRSCPWLAPEGCWLEMLPLSGTRICLRACRRVEPAQRKAAWGHEERADAADITQPLVPPAIPTQWCAGGCLTTGSGARESWYGASTVSMEHLPGCPYRDAWGEGSWHTHEWEQGPRARPAELLQGEGKADKHWKLLSKEHWTTSNWKASAQWKKPLTKWKGNLGTGKEYLQVTYLVRC